MSDSPPIRVLIAEDDDPLRAAIGDLIGQEKLLELVGAAANAGEAIELAGRLSPAVAVLGVKIPGGGGPHAVAKIRAVSPGTRSLALSTSADRSGVLEMLRAGAVGYLVKGGPPDELVEAVIRAARGQASVSASTLAELVGDLGRDLGWRAEAMLLHRSEERFEALLESAPDAIVVVDVEGRIVLVNEQTEQLFDYSRGDLLGRPLELLLPERFHADHLDHRDDFLADPRTRPMETGLELGGRRRDGSEFAVDISLSAIETDDGRFVAAFVRSVRPREPRTDPEVGLNERRALLAHLVASGEEERRRIAGDIHDDSIQVMTAAGMRLQILRRSLDDPRQLSRLAELEEAIRTSISRLRDLIFELRPPALDHDGLSAALRAYLEKADAETATCYRLEDRLTSQPCSSTRLILYRIAQEVLMNVRKHANAKNATVTLAARDGGYYVRVTDDGIGFTPDLNSMRPGHLGLAAIRERAELAGGWLRAESAPDAGATVEFWLADNQDDEPSGDTPAEPGLSRA